MTRSPLTARALGRGPTLTGRALALVTLAFGGALASGTLGCDDDSARAEARSPAAEKPAPNVAPKRNAKPTAAKPAGAKPPGANATSTARQPAGDGSYREVTWTWSDTPVGPMQVVVVIPKHASAEHKLPVLVAMHGRGEAFKGPEKGARGWVDDYWLPAALKKLHAPPITKKDMQGFAEADHLTKLNDSLKAQPYRGVIGVFPFTPDILAGERAFVQARPLAKFIVDQLLPRVYRETPAIGTPESTGVDGVSLGGRASLLVGLERPEAFGVVGTLQPAFDRSESFRLAHMAKAAREKNPKLKFRLLTSDGDFYLGPTKKISAEFRAEGVDHRLDIVPGPHDYEFNRGPGVYEMLLFHDRSLRGERFLE